MKYLAIVGAVFMISGCQNANQKEMLEEIRGLRQDIKALPAEIAKNTGGNAAARARQQRPPRRRGPTPGKRYAITTEGMPFKGNPNAPITMVKAFEYACPACLGARGFTDAVLKEFGDKVKVVYKDFVVHPSRAWTQAFAACAAHEQGKWKEMEEAIWEKGFKARKFDRAHYEKLAKDMGLNMQKFKADYDGICNQRSRASHAEMAGVGVAGTPTFFINGKVLPSRSVAAVKQMIDEEMKEIEKFGKGGAAYYKEVVVGKGAKPTKVPLPRVPK